ncbi:MAG: GNAT family N-acetyltransferase [Bacteroidales bacterium]
MINFRIATASDIPLIRTLASETWRATYGDILSEEQLEWMFEWMYSEESLKRQMQVEKQQFFLASLNEEPCGYISIERKQEALFHFHKIYVHPDFQGIGIGRALIEKGIAHIRSQGVLSARIELNVNRQNQAVGFYQQMGFSIVSQGDFAIGNGYFMNDYIMSLEIYNRHNSPKVEILNIRYINGASDFNEKNKLYTDETNSIQ